MSIADDVAEVMIELGTVLTIHNTDGTTVSEYVDFEAYPDQSSLFTRMFFWFGTMAYTSVIKMGDIVSFSGLHFLVTNKIGSFFENTLIENAVLFYRCNVIGDFKAYVDNPEYDRDYERESPWRSIASDVRACFSEKKLSNDPEHNLEISSVSNLSNILYVSAVYDIKIGDRWILSSGRAFQVDSISRFEIDDVLVCQVSVDERG